MSFNRYLFLSSVIFDPASFYGHHEFELAIAGMFGGFTRKFYDAYHSLIPKALGFAGRNKLYVLFHYLNHWWVHIIDSCLPQGREFEDYFPCPTGITLELDIEHKQFH